MASPNPDQSSNLLKLVIKSANQKYDDFIVDNFELNWNIKRLKQFLNDNYPKNPETDSIRLIYSGKLLHDHCTLKEVLRQNSETKSHIIHLVHSNNNSNKGNTSNVANRSNNNLNDENEVDLDNELTPNSSSISSSSSTSSSSSENSSPLPSLDASINRPPNNSFGASNSFSQIQNDLNNLFQLQQQQRQEQINLTPKQKFNHIHENFIRYYESVGIPVQTNSWYSCYVQHMALYNYMYSNYVQSLNADLNLNELFSQTPVNVPTSNQASTTNERPVQEQQADQPTPNPAPVPPPQPLQQQPPAQNRAPARAPANADGAERDDDWLSLLHNCVSFLVLFSIIYYYSSMERFLVIFSIVLILILYHNGWLTLQRRQIRNVRINRRREGNQQEQQMPGAREAGNEENQEENATDQPEEQEVVQNANPGIFRLIGTFVLTFFTSLIPERPRAAAN